MKLLSVVCGSFHGLHIKINTLRTMSFQSKLFQRLLSYLMIITLIQSCAHPTQFYKLKERKLKNRSAVLVIENNLPTNHVFLHMGENCWRLEDSKLVNGSLKGNLQEIDDEVYSYYLKALDEKKNKLKVKKNTIGESSANQIHLFTDKMVIDNNQVSVNTVDISNIQTLSKRKGFHTFLNSLYVTAVAIPVLFLGTIIYVVIWFGL